jgi:glyoxylase-like metal-dependent hydrolase (beta-lactamase superfamily II)
MKTNLTKGMFMKRCKQYGRVVLMGILITVATAARCAVAPAAVQNEVVYIDSTLIVVSGGGGNSGMVIGERAVVVIDTKMMGASEELYTLAREKAGQKPIIVVNTHFHRDHVTGNHFYAGSKIYIGKYDKEFLLKNIDSINQPTDFVTDSLILDLGNETVRLYNLGQAHTFHDLVVFVSKHRVLFAGDLIFNRINPVLRSESGANISGWIKALERILARWNDANIVPGHGPMGDREMVISMLRYFRDMTAAAADAKQEARVKEQYKGWMELPNMTSPEKTIEYIRANEFPK